MYKQYKIFKLLLLSFIILSLISPALRSFANPFKDEASLYQPTPTAFNTQPTPVPQRAVQASVVFNDYVLDAGDIVEITDETMGTIATHLRILSDGTAQMSLIGDVPLGGMTLKQAVEYLNERYKTYFVNPNMSIQLNYQRPSRIYVKGQVANPGVYISGNTLAPEQTKVARLGGADTQSVYYKLYLTDVLIMAGGLSPMANIQDIKITRSMPKKQVIHVNLWDMFNGEEVVQDIGLSDRDVVTIGTISDEMLNDETQWHEMETTNIATGVFKINVIGAVKTPGNYDVSAKDAAIVAISKAGGFNELAQKNDVYLLRPLPNGQILRKKLDFKDSALTKKNKKKSKKSKKNKNEAKDSNALETALRPNDVILVQESGLKKTTKFTTGLINKASSAAFLPLFNQMIDFSK